MKTAETGKPRPETISPAVRARACWRFIAYLCNRFIADRCLEYAASLTFTTLLAFVPMMAIALSVLAQFPVFDAIGGGLEGFVLDSFVPEFGAAVLAEVAKFTQNTGQLSALGAVGLTVAVFMLLLAVESAFNSIWHVTVPRTIMWRILAFWTILTLGPILLGMSVTLSGYLFAAARTESLDGWLGGGRAALMLPPLLEFAAFGLLYGTIPNRPVGTRHAVAGAVVATVLFEVLKKGFGLYVTVFPTYQTIYGAMAAIPIIMIWVYVAWTIGLFGAVLAASLADRQTAPSVGALPPMAPGERLTTALSLLSLLRAASVRGETVHRKSLLKQLHASAFLIETVLRQLENARYVTQAGRDRWVLARDLDTITLYHLYNDLHLGVAAGALAWTKGSTWSARAGESIARLDDLGRECMNMPLKELFSGDVDGTDGEDNVVPFGRDRR